MEELVISLEVPNYIRKVRLSKGRRTLYYKWDGIDIRARKSKGTKGKSIPKKYLVYQDTINTPAAIRGFLGVKVDSNYRGYINSVMYVDNNLENILNLRRFCQTKFNLTARQAKGAQFVVCDINKEPILANPKVAGTPNNKVINGQDFYSGTLVPIVRAKVVTTIKKSFVPHIMEQWKSSLSGELVKIPTPVYPNSYIIVCEVHDTIKNKFDKSKSELGTAWDVGNRVYMPYLKTFLDIICTGKVDRDTKVFEPALEDDHRLIIAGEQILFCPIKEGETPKLIFKIIKHKFNET